MPRSNPNIKKTAFVDINLYNRIKAGIDNYFFVNEGQNVSQLSMSSPQTYDKLISFIESENKKIEITGKFLVALYRGEKTNHSANRAIIAAICKTLKVSQEEEDQFPSIILDFKRLSKQDKIVQDFAGQYKLFLGGRKQPSLYPKIYENHLTIYENGLTKMFNPFSKKVFYGYCMIREHKTLQILSFDIKEGDIAGVGSLIMVKIDEYKKLAQFFPGINLSFDGATVPVIYHTLLASDFAITIKNKIVETYFNETAKNLRMECPDLSYLELLRQSFDKK